MRLSQYTEFENLRVLPRSRFDTNRNGRRFLEPHAHTVDALTQFDKCFGIFHHQFSAEKYARHLNGRSEFACSNLISKVAVFSEMTPISTYAPYEVRQYFVHAELNPWGKHALLWLNKGCVYDLYESAPNHNLTAQFYDKFLDGQRVPFHIFHAAQSLPRYSSYARIRDKLIQFKLAATARNGMYEVR